MSWSLYPGNDTVPTVEEEGWVGGSRVAKYFDCSGIRFLKGSALSELLYRLRYKAFNPNK